MSLGQRLLVVFLCGFHLSNGFIELKVNESSGVPEKLVSNGSDQDGQSITPYFNWHLLHRLEKFGVNVNGSSTVNDSLVLKESDNDAHANDNDTSPNHLSWKQLIGRLELNASSSVEEKPCNGTFRGLQSVWSPIPEYFDWRDHKGVSPVKDQGQCDACWAFSTVANIESQLWIQDYPLILSEQFLIDCNTMGAGCSKAGIVNTFADIVSNIGGVIQNLDYPPYIQHKAKCRWNNDSSLLVPVVGLERAQPLNEAQMAQLVYTHGPLSAAINDAMMVDPHRDPKSIDQPTESQCPSGQEHLNHAVLIVGYNVYKDNDGSQIPYWIIKNSWGEAWGDRGYYYLQRGINACGIARDVSFAKIPSF